MKKTLSFLYYIVIAATLASCNLFIDDDLGDAPDGEEHWENVPVHSGEGYDAPVTITQAGCEVTYQFRDCVRVLQVEDQRHIAQVRQDPANAFIELHYAKTTPEQYLPVPGEILVSGATDLFPSGCNHRVRYRVDEPDEYVYIATFCTLDDTYLDLRIDGQMSYEYDEEYYVMPDGPYDLDENGDPIRDEAADESGEEAAARQKVEFDVEGMHVKLEDGVTEFNFPVTVNASYGHLGISMPAEKNHCTVTNEFDFSGFSIKDNQYTVKLSQTVEQSLCIEATATKDWNNRLAHFRPVKGKAITIGFVVIVLFIDVNVDLTATVGGSASFEKYKKTVNEYTINLRELTYTKNEHVIADKDWSVICPEEIAVNASLQLDLKLVIGLGIYGRIISARVIPTLSAIVEAKEPLGTRDSKGGVTFSLSDRAGVQFKLQWKVTVGVFLDLSLKNILGGFTEVGSSGQKALLAELEANAKQTSQYYQDIVDGNQEAFDPSKKHYTKKGKLIEPGDNETGVSFDIGPFDIIKPINISWFPTIKDNSFTVNRQYSDRFEKMTFTAQYTCGSVGFLSLTGFKYTPALRVMLGSQYVTTLFPEEGGDAARIKRGQTYHFQLPTLSDDKTYTVAPCYFRIPMGSSTQPLCLDKGLPVSFTTPSTAIDDVELEDVTEDYSEYAGYGSEQQYEYCYTFKVNTYVALKGAENIEYWGVEEQNTKKKKDYSRHHASMQSDGTYRFHWTFHRYSHEPELKVVTCVFNSYMHTKADKGAQDVVSEPYKVRFWSNGDAMIMSSRSATPLTSWSEEADGGDDEVECVLDAITDPQGRVVYQAPSRRSPSPLPFSEGMGSI